MGGLNGWNAHESAWQVAIVLVSKAGPELELASHAGYKIFNHRQARNHQLPQLRV